MAASPPWKVYLNRLYLASCKDPVDAYQIVEFRGSGAELRYTHDKRVFVYDDDEGRLFWDNYEELEQILRIRAGLSPIPDVSYGLGGKRHNE